MIEARWGAILGLGVVLGLLSSCTIQRTLGLPKSTGPVDPAVRSTLSRVAVTVDSSTTEVRLDGVRRGILDGLLTGLCRGLGTAVVFPVVGAVVGLFVPVPGWPVLSVVGGGILGAGAAAVYFPYSLVNGMATAIPPDSCDAAERTIRKALIGAPWERAFTEQLSRALSNVSASAPPVDHESSVGEGPGTTDARVEITFQAVGSDGPWLGSMNLWTVDVPVGLFVEGDARLVRTLDHRLLGEVGFRFTSVGNEKLLLAWAMNDGEAARTFFETASREVAAGVIEEWFPWKATGRGDIPPDRSGRPGTQEGRRSPWSALSHHR